MVSKRFGVIALHTHTECNLDCSFCYRKKIPRKEQYPFKFFEELIPYLKDYTGQVAFGGGEPFYFPKEIVKLTKICVNNGLIANVTTNGTLLYDKTDAELKRLLANVTLLSISMDKEKIKTENDLRAYFKLTQRIKKLKLCKVGCNLLIDETMTPQKLYVLVTGLFKEVDRVYALYPKNIIGPNIIDKKMKMMYQLLTFSNENFYVDDLTHVILKEEKYENWKTPCHYGKILSIDEVGNVKGCSFESEALFKMKKPGDIRKLDGLEIEERKVCPFLKVIK